MRTSLTVLAAAALVAACDGNPFGVIISEGGGDTSEDGVYLDDENPSLTLNNISYDPATDTLTLNNIPFDDPNNRYDRIAGTAFANNFNAYQSNPAPGTNEVQYFAIFRRSASGNTQVAAAGTTEYVDFGYGGAGAQRLGSNPNLPSSGIYSYNGEYGAVRTTLNPGANTLQYVTGDVALAVDFDDFDGTGAVGGTIQNRILYDTTGAPVGALAGFISLTDTDIDFNTDTIKTATATEFDGAGTQTGTGNWEGVFAGPGGNEIAGILFVDSANVRETGGFVATQ